MIDQCAGFAFDVCNDASFFRLFVQRYSSDDRYEEDHFANFLRDRYAYVGGFRAIFGTRDSNDGRYKGFAR